MPMPLLPDVGVKEPYTIEDDELPFSERNYFYNNKEYCEGDYT